MEDCIEPRRKRMGPGVVVNSSRMTKRRCETCKGREGCIHLSIFKQAEEEDTLIKSLDSMRITNKKTDIKETEVSSDLQDNNGEIDFKKKPSPKPQQDFINPIYQYLLPAFVNISGAKFPPEM